VHDMASALRTHPLAAALFDPERGDPEVSLFWRDARAEIELRARLDWMPHTDGGRLLVGDYKTADSAAPRKFARSAADFGYPQQDDFYRAGIRALDLAEDVAFLFVVQAKTAPYLVSVNEIHPSDLRAAHLKNREAIDLYAACLKANEWPAYDGVNLIELPAWYRRHNEEEATFA